MNRKTLDRIIQKMVKKELLMEEQFSNPEQLGMLFDDLEEMSTKLKKGFDYGNGDLGIGSSVMKNYVQTIERLLPKIKKLII